MITNDPDSDIGFDFYYASTPLEHKNRMKDKYIPIAINHGWKFSTVWEAVVFYIIVETNEKKDNKKVLNALRKRNKKL